MGVWTIDSEPGIPPDWQTAVRLTAGESLPLVKRRHQQPRNEYQMSSTEKIEGVLRGIAGLLVAVFCLWLVGWESTKYILIIVVVCSRSGRLLLGFNGFGTAMPWENSAPGWTVHLLARVV